MDDLLGQVYGNYRLVRLIGSGGFASVYQGKHIILDTKVAVKILDRLEPHETGRFLQEAKIIADLRHPNIIRLLDFAIQDGRPFLVMEYAASGTLADQHLKGAILTLPQVASYVKQVADALQYAHDRGLIHRDVKPSNMLVQENSEIVLSDFGIARTSSDISTTASGSIAGTPIFMAPEQALGSARAASDQYSLAVCAYLWLCGTYPFQGHNPLEIIQQHLGAQPRPPRELNPAISPQVEQVILMALAKRPEDRFRTIGEFAGYLEDASLGREVVIPSPTQKLSLVKSSPLLPPSPSEQTLPAIPYPGMLPPLDYTTAGWRGDQTAYGALPAPSYSVPSFKSDELKEQLIDQTVRQMETMVAPTNPISIFIAYAPNDAELCANLKNQLTTLIYQHQLRIWYDHDISPGKERMKIMEERLNASHMIILLVSASFLGSEYHYRQMQLALEMHRAGTKRVIPILLRPSDWEKTPLGELQALPKDNRPVTTWHNLDEALVNIVKGIRLAVEEL